MTDNSQQIGWVNTGNADFIQSISNEALQSAAANHPYLNALQSGNFPDIDFAFRDFAFQYGLYSANFARYVSAVIGNLSTSNHQAILRGNLAEEQGDTHDVELPDDVLATINGVPHPILYLRFQEAIGVDLNSCRATSQCPGALWSQNFLALCLNNECVGAGAIGIGTEFIVAKIFDQILNGLRKHTNLTAIQRVFFDLHSVCDDKHAAEMLSISNDLAVDTASCDDIRFGVRKALDLRAEFWDAMMQRAENPIETQSLTADSLAPVGY